MAKADDDKKKAEQAKLEAEQAELAAGQAELEAEPAELAELAELAKKAKGLVLVRFEKTCAGPKGTYTVGTVAELDAEFVKALEKDNAVSRIK